MPSVSTIAQTAETSQLSIKSDIPPEPECVDIEPSGLEKLRQRMSPHLLYVVSTAQFLDIG